MTSSITGMDSDILRRLAEGEVIENLSLTSYNSASSRLRALTGATQPMAMSMLNSVRGMGGSGGNASLFSSGGQATPQAPSMYDVSVFQQRLALEEQSRMRVIAQAAAMRHQQYVSQLQQQQQQQQMQQIQQQQQQIQQQQQLQHQLKRAAVSRVTTAQDRLRKKRKVMDWPSPTSTRVSKPNSSSFFLPKIGGKDFIPSIDTLDGFRFNWDRFVAQAKSLGGNAEEQYAFVRNNFGKTLAQNRCQKIGIRKVDRASGKKRTKSDASV
jgi:hypothetical protein